MSNRVFPASEDPRPPDECHAGNRLPKPEPRLIALSRREVIRAGSLGLLGLSLPRFLEGAAQSASAQSSGSVQPLASASFGRAKACILLFMWGGPAQQETWDMKPDAPEEVRGEFKPIATNVPGIKISEHFPLLARQIDRLAVIRSVYHADVNHTTATHELLTGRPSRGPAAVNSVKTGRTTAAVLAHLRRGQGATALPPLRSDETRDSQRRTRDSSSRATARAPAGWGLRFNPFTIDQTPASLITASANSACPRALVRADLPIGAVSCDPSTIRPAALEAAAESTPCPGHYHRAYDLLANRKAIEAFDLSQKTRGSATATG